MNYYNENDPNAAEWIRELIRQQFIPAGHIDTRSIVDVRGGDLAGFTQCHFFAGIGGWSLALALAGWPAGREVWTGSCPCQPFSVAGKNRGTRDKRHLWPHFKSLIAERRPATVFGEQVASKAGRRWLAGVFADLEGMAYTRAGADLCAAGAGAPHIRQRLWWVAHAGLQGCKCGGIPSGSAEAGKILDLRTSNGGTARGMADAASLSGAQQRIGSRERTDREPQDAAECSGTCRLANLLKPGLEGFGGTIIDGREPGRNDPASGGSVATGGAVGRVANNESEQLETSLRKQETERVGGFADGRDIGRMDDSISDGRLTCGDNHGGNVRLVTPANGSWSNFDILPCLDGKARRVESGTFPLADGFPGRVGLLRGYGNAIVPELAAEFIQAYLEIVT